MNNIFRKIAHKTAYIIGTPWAFMLSVFACIVWAIAGPYYNYSDTWQLVINTGTTVLTFLMLFLVQNTQNRDAKALQLKLDELLRGSKGSRNSFLDIEELNDEELRALEVEFQQIREKYMKRIEHRKIDL
ncbi:MAG: low affinity iron permease family protein [Patescibacteria group bacterium]